MRLVTRADFDGLACAVLLKELGLMDNWLYVHPKDVQDGKYPGDPNDIVANVPFIPGCGYWFDHHSSEGQRLGDKLSFQGASKPEKSCARVIWDYFGGRERFGAKFDEMLHFVDRVDSGDLTREEIEHPQGWVLMGFLMDPRTGLGYYKHYRISNYQLMEELIDHCRTMPIEEILVQPDVAERLSRYRLLNEEYKIMVRKWAVVHDNVLVLDLREQDPIYPGNRFLMYAMYPEANVSVQVVWGKQMQNVAFQVGKSVVNRSCPVDIGRLMLQYGGGGHRQVGTCQVPAEEADSILVELINAMHAGCPLPEETP